ncbi:MAG: helix-turn-helix domain-containing protein [Candidatus Marsarchaeota archaeon]|nr:helix-turn-helix domain-containing protein [Candidatus Marsarchaeota archaeon]
MTPEQVASYLQLTKDTIYRLIRQKKLAATRIGRAYRVPKEDLEAFILANSTRPDVREALFRRVGEIAQRNPKLKGDEVLEDLERLDQKRGSKRQAV